MSTPQMDPNVHVPAAIRAQAARSAELQAQMIKAQQEGEPAPEPANDPAPQDPPLTAQQPEPVNEPAPQDPGLTPGVTNEPGGDWERKFLSMKGRFEHEQKQAKTLRDQLNELSSTVSDLRTQLATQELRQPVSAPAEIQPERLVSDEEIAEFGPEFLDVVARRAKEAVAPELARLRSENEGLKQRLNGVGEVFQKSARDKMLEQLDKDVTDWRTTNLSDEFKTWLELPDAYSGVKRLNTLRDAFDRNDTRRVAAFFKGFHADVAAVAPRDADPSPASGKVPLETLAAPGRAKTVAADHAPSEKPTFTRAQVGAFYRDAAVGKFRGREAEYETLNKQIIEAGREGRIR